MGTHKIFDNSGLSLSPFEQPGPDVSKGSMSFSFLFVVKHGKSTSLRS